MTEKDVLLDVGGRLERLGLSYMLTGSLASMYYGIPRFTHDIDIVIQIPPVAIERLVQEFQPEYFVDAQMVRESYQGILQFNLLHYQTGIKIDFWMTRSDAFHRSMFERRHCEAIWGQKIWICTPEDIVLHKLFWNQISPSDRQIADVKGVLQVCDKKLDWAYIHKWADQLSVKQILHQIQEQLLKD